MCEGAKSTPATVHLERSDEKYIINTLHPNQGNHFVNASNEQFGQDVL